MVEIAALEFKIVVVSPGLCKRRQVVPQVVLARVEKALAGASPLCFEEMAVILGRRVKKMEWQNLGVCIKEKELEKEWLYS